VTSTVNNWFIDILYLALTLSYCHTPITGRADLGDDLWLMNIC
jgi:hypothetical protein